MAQKFTSLITSYFYKSFFLIFILTIFSCEKEENRLEEDCPDFFYGENCDQQIITFEKLYSGIDNTERFYRAEDITQLDNDDYLAIGSSGLLYEEGKIFINQFSSTGELLNEELCDGLSGKVYNIEPTPDGGYIVVGHNKALNGEPFIGDRIFLAKLDASGNMEWSNLYITSLSLEGDFAKNIIPTSDNGFLITGNVAQMDDPTFHPSAAFLFKINQNGNEEWHKQLFFGNEVIELGHDLLETDDGNYLLLGSSGSVLFLTHLDQDGNVIWVQSYQDKFNYYHRGYKLQTSPDSDLFISGFFTTNFIENINDIFLIKTNANGQEQWTKTYGGDSDDKCFDFKILEDGNLIMVGSTNSFAEFNEDVYLLKLDSNGDEIWSRTFNRSTERGKAIHPTKDGGFVILAEKISEDYFNDFQPSGKIYLIKTDENGQVQ